jgi:hypothetical protein
VSNRDDMSLIPPHGAAPMAPDGQPTSPTSGEHPSDHRRREREAQGVEMRHHMPEKSGDEIMSEAQREHAERLERHARRALIRFSAHRLSLSKRG